MPQIGYAHRQAPRGRHGMVASAHPLASLAGVEVLKSGGNAADAAVATNAVLAVTQPCYCGLGGDFFALYYEAATGQVHYLDGSGRSGSRASLEELHRRGLDRVPEEGPGSVSVPGVTHAWRMLLERFGTRTLKTLLALAVHYAADGFAMSDIVSQSIRERAVEIGDAEWRRIFLPNGRSPLPGDCFRQPDLARTLSSLGDDADLLYRGRLARQIVDRLGDEGFVTLSDLAEHSGAWGEPIATTYRDYRVYETAPPTQGIAVLGALNILEGLKFGAHSVDSSDRFHLMLEAMKLAHADRERWLADPAHAQFPLETLLSKNYAARQGNRLDAKRAQNYATGGTDGDTTAFVVADRHGNLLSGIQSLSKQFGAGIVPGGTGVVLQNRGASFVSEPAHPNCFAPRKRPRHTLIACLATREGQPRLGLATSGGDGQAAFHVQVLTNVLDYGMGIQEAIERPRFAYGRPKVNDLTDLVELERRIPSRVRADLLRRGHTIRLMPEFAQLGHVQAVAVHDGTLTGGADPRGDGAALGY